MTLFGRIFKSTIGRKFLMAVTGVVLVAFVAGHLIGNLQVFEDPDKINGYSHFLHSLGPTLWAVRAVLFVCVIIHIWAATTLAIEDWKARGSERYRVKTWLQATFSSRYMRWTGYIVLAFVAYHLAQFTFGVVQTDTYKTNLPPYTMAHDYRIFGFTAVRAGTEVLDVYSMVIRGFQNGIVAGFYIVAVGLLSLHLLHGIESLFQTFGWRNERWGRRLRAVVTIACAAYFLGNLAIPGAVLAGKLEPRLATAPMPVSRP
jgi:succinate dehydrogenase / fumarate reductase cytochrome b subunit